ncbi:hypothetical protein NMY22_g16859 [Coprinellus aureogranulatus]|nr:hypothetical protein NMY22_g16859 [Coprinellus aureogranulatus]
MPYGIINDRKRAMTADYVGRMTSRGYKGRLLRPDRKPRDRKQGRTLNLNVYANSETPLPVPLLPLNLKLEPTDNDLSQLPFAMDTDFGSDTKSADFFTPLPHDRNDPYRMKILQKPSKPSQGSSSSELMQEWVEEKWAVYLKHIVDREDAQSATCEGCNIGVAVWRCLDCLGRPCLCKDCCRIGHRLSPFPKVEAWNGAHWTPAWLWHVGTIICLGHGRTPCPKYEASLEQLEQRLIAVNSLTLDQDNSFCAKPQKRSVGCGNVVCFLHTNGFHYLPVYTCWCSEAPPDDTQFLDHAFYPASWKAVRSALTFSVLQHFNLFKLHAHLSTDTYSDILCRLTNDIFPSEAPDRQSTLRRVWAQWNYLSALKKNGYERAQLGDRPEPGSLALYCPACPQPGINLPENWTQDKDQWKFRRYLVADGNFVLDHLAVNKEGHRLINGAAYVTEPTRYARHVEISRERNEPSSCAKLRAVSERNVFKKGYDVTGVVAIACARHGCFAPGGIVDLQKGERQLNVDYALVEALRLTKATETPGENQEGPYLSLDRSFPLDFVIGLFHVHGHKDECLARFAPKAEHESWLPVGTHG